MAAFEIFFACFLAMLGLAASVLTTTYAEWVRMHPLVGNAGWVCLAGSFGFLCAAVVQWRRVHAKLIIYYAKWYGNNPEDFSDRSVHVRTWIVDKSINHRVHEEELGDTAPHQMKKLEVCYSIAGGKPKRVVVVNGNYLLIPEIAS